MSLLDKLKKNSTIKESSLLEKSILFNDKDMITTPIYGLNIALSGALNGGFVPGLTMWAGPSKHFKTLFSLLMAKAYMDKYPEAVLLFYDSEFGTPISYFDSVGIDKSRVIHTPLTNIEEFKFDIMTQLDGIKRGDKVIIIVDSIGNMASKKEVDDALDQKSVADMTRAKQIKSAFRMITPHLTLKDIPMVVVNHIYMTMEMYAKAIVGGGTGSYYSADNIYILGRQQEKDKKELSGWNFIINVEKSRYVQEKSKIPITVRFEGGLSVYSGLLELAVESGIVTKPKPGRYSRVDLDTGEIEEKEWKEAATDCEEFFKPILESKHFQDFIEKTYKISHGSLVGGDTTYIDEEEDENE